ncbi:phytanoyl-CoA hydroxylase-interacting protein-like [Liolophura sinensis]|uniref:phytanoyl-CoA hydroxylase-interacting protein-like n=1 Tax=Liolophura sinensis TaxID=3198878 RepID=UPI003158F682
MATLRDRCSPKSPNVLVEYDSTKKALVVTHKNKEGNDRYVACITFDIKQKCHDGNDLYFPWLVSHVPLGATMSLPLTMCGLSDNTVLRKCEPTSARSDNACVVRVQFSKPSSFPLFPYVGQTTQCDMIEITGLGPRMNAVQLYHRAVLYHKSRKTNQRQMNRATFLYRNKPKDYFDDIFLRHCGIMKPYVKDFTGDPKCPISGKLKGLFFSSNVDNNTKEPLKISAFGPYRFQVPLTALLGELGCWRIYFADFYCMDKNNSSHHITLVLCKEGTESDDICKKYLLTLPPENPFFQVKDSGFMVSSHIWVEVIYTEPINVQKMWSSGAVMKTVESKTRSIKAGIPKNSRCLICNHAMYQSWEALPAYF